MTAEERAKLQEFFAASGRHACMQAVNESAAKKGRIGHSMSVCCSQMPDNGEGLALNR
jgi:hypothetical protein